MTPEERADTILGDARDRGDLARRIENAIAQEREACAQLLDSERVRLQGSIGRWSEAALALRNCARMIRARSDEAVPSCEDVAPDGE